MADLFTHTDGESDSRATVRLDPSRRGDEVSPELYGKFGEHLYTPRNVTNVLEAQVLFNPTFGSWKFGDQQYGADGGNSELADPDAIDERIETYAERHGLPEAERLQQAYHDGTALWWFPYGNADDVRTSPDIGTADDRAQRFETGSTEGYDGLAQWCYLPVHRTTEFEGKVTLRAPEETTVRLAIHGLADDGSLGAVLAETDVTARDEYRTASFSLELPTVDRDDERLFGFSVTTRKTDGNVVVDRVCCYPDDHVATADPEIVDLLSEMNLSVLRWPGGNFVSGYHWEDGVGPIEERPTKPNPAWDALETNLFGTDEFVALCEAVGCEPMICLNAGSATPEDAARWVEYCNGSTDTEMGALRAEHGHPEPYDVAYWEVGNELYGSWQIGWTTPEGNADRFRRFKEAMEAVDESIDVFACGNRLTDWNEPLLEELEADDWLTDHVLVECHADPETDPVELFNAHSGFASQLREEYEAVAAECRAAGLEEVRQAITELQLFTRFDELDEESEADDGAVEDRENGERHLDRETLPTNKSITEVVFDATIIHECIRSGTVEMVTHSGVGNHGGGLRKSQGHVWADPCYYGQQLGSRLIGGTPIGVDVTCHTFSTETAWGTDTSEWFGELEPVTDEPAIDAMAVTDADEHDLAIVLVHRDAGADAIDVTVSGEPLAAVDGDEVTVDRLSAETMYERNTLEEPDRITPTTDSATVDEDSVTVSLPPCSMVRLTADREK
ncbi:alpha-L-arabinofuranosidase C-terminal domain-containing protein [Halopiger aswanensis]|uniref:non-reducing end alpha-L-arabinofuranosidase n=1 Tax=Halopiger aswanensis TaxID=148449 RepID=A0A3R7DWY7_9EURY|nr:alpha-L-arabinofuranosidase C-terminal domain-containing protein [Halopiger aswanensis]RKD88928.1 alpha-N-arabinofuranosidase [Halopiger aswanensis]